MRCYRFAIAALLALTLSACTDVAAPQNDVAELLVVPANAEPGDTVVLQLTNKTTSSLMYNLCYAVLQPINGSAPIESGSGNYCLAVGYGLPAGGVATGMKVLPPSLAPGVYRFRARIELEVVPRMSESVVVRSSAVRVE